MLAKIFSIFPAVVIAATVGVNAQNLRGAAEPSELPPASFGGAQYVDSAGCVFLRAGVNGNTVWIPRVTRSRKLVCGRAPTFASVQRTALPVPVVQPVQTQPVVRVATPVPAALVIRRTRTVATPSVAVAVVRPQGGIRVPAGFRSAWTDDRLNPNRGPQTERGNAQMELVWTNTVPRRLVARK